MWDRPFQLKICGPQVTLKKGKTKQKNDVKGEGGLGEKKVLKVGSVAYLLTLWATSNAERGETPLTWPVTIDSHKRREKKP